TEFDRASDRRRDAGGTSMNTPGVTAPLNRKCVARAFGRVLKECRKARGISQEELASRTDIDRTYPSLLERGLRTPTLAMLLLIEEALDVPQEQWIAGTLTGLCPPRDQLDARTQGKSAEAR